MLNYVMLYIYMSGTRFPDIRTGAKKKEKRKREKERKKVLKPTKNKKPYIQTPREF